MKKKSTSQSAFFNLRILAASAFCLLGIAVALFAQGNRTKQTQASRSTAAQDAPGTQRPDVVQMVGPVMLTTNLKNLPYIPTEGEQEAQPLTRFPRGGGAPPPLPPSSPWLQKLIKGLFRPTPTMPGPLITFEGMNLVQSGCSCQPPDSDGDVGPNHYVNTVNSSIKIFDKSGNPLNGTNGTTFNSFFSGLVGTPCANANQGDPFTLYDHQADRWVISDFAFPAFPGTSFWQCVGVSQSPDPVAGPWALYAIQIDPANSNQLGDYPKFSMWNDGGTQNAYFFTVNLFTSPTTFVGTRAFALDRPSMLTGGPANAIAFTIPIAGFPNGYSLVPATFRTGDPPPAGTDEMILAIDSPANENTPLTQVHGWKFHVDFATPGNSTLGVGANHSPNAEITTSPFVEAWTNAAGFTIVPQEGTTNRIQTLGDRMMTPVVYQNRSGTESLWADYTTIINFPSGPTTVRWYQFDVTGGNFPATPLQQQDWSNGGGGDGLFRFMPSIAVDQSGNAAIGYSVSSSTTFPGIRYAGRLVSDPPSNMGQGEATMFNGTGSQTSGPRWGDYSNLTIDPVDNMSFWHVNEYLAANGAQWHQRIGKFDFVGGPTPTPTVTPSATPTATPGGCSWSAGPDMPTPLVRAVGVYFPDGNFYTMGGRTSDTTGDDFQHVLKFDTTSNTWTQMPSTLPDNQMNNMACGVLTVSGTPLIYCVGGSAAGATTATARVFTYDPATDTPALLGSDDWPGDAIGTILPGGFTVANNKLYILGGFNILVASTNEIWEFDPNAASGSRWTQKVNTPEGVMYAPTCTIGGIIYLAGASDFDTGSGAVIDTTNSFSFDPVANTIGSITPIPRATGETRALNFNGQMYVMGGGRVAPNPSNEVDIYDPATNTWSLGIPFNNARRNFPTDTNGTDHIWLAGGYDIDGITPLASMEIFDCPQTTPTPTPTATATATATATPTGTPTRQTPTPRPRPTPYPRPTP